MKYLLSILCLLVFSCDSDSPTAPESIYGCTEASSCSYDPDVTVYVPSSCLELDECGECGGDNSTCQDDCDIPYGDTFFGNSSGEICDCWDNVLDECGVCGGDNLYCSDCNGVPNGPADCLNEFGDTVECGENEGDYCNCDGSLIDDCGDCNGPGLEVWLANGYCGCHFLKYDECGVCGGQNFLDDCGVCEGGNQSCNRCVERHYHYIDGSNTGSEDNLSIVYNCFNVGYYYDNGLSSGIMTEEICNSMYVEYDCYSNDADYSTYCMETTIFYEFGQCISFECPDDGTNCP